MPGVVNGPGDQPAAVRREGHANPPVLRLPARPLLARYRVVDTDRTAMADYSQGPAVRGEGMPEKGLSLHSNRAHLPARGNIQKGNLVLDIFLSALPSSP